MSEAPDKDSKTEEATEKRREQALESGNVPVSREMSHLGFVCAVMAIVAWMSVAASSRVAGVLATFIERPHEFQLDAAADVSALLRAILAGTLPLLAPLPAALIVTGVAFQVLQTPLRLSWKRLVPKAERISMASGWKRIVSATGLVELGKGILKHGFLGAVIALFVTSHAASLQEALLAEPRQLPALLAAAAMSVLVPASVGVAVLAVADMLFSRFSWSRRLRMTRQEVRDETKQSEGDQILAHRRRSIARSRIRKMMISGAPRATLVVANPTHYAVALRYVLSEGGAPMVVAKGQDLIALQIRRIAKEHGIPVVEDKALARSLYSAVEINQAVPREFYAAIASIMLMLRKAGNRHVVQALEA